MDTEVHSSYEMVKDHETTLSFRIPKGVSRAAAMSLIAWHHAKFTTDIELEMSIASAAALSKAADPAQLYEECTMSADEFVQVQKNTLGLHAPEPLEISRDAVRQKTKESYRVLVNELSSAPTQNLGKSRWLKGPKSLLETAPDNLLENLVNVAVAKLVAKTGIDPNVTVMEDTIMPDMTASDFQVLLSETFSESMESYQVEYKDDYSKNYKASGSADPNKPYPGTKNWKSGKGKGKSGKAKNADRQVPWMKEWSTDKGSWNTDPKDSTNTTSVEATSEHSKPSDTMEDKPKFVPPPTRPQAEKEEESKSAKENPWFWNAEPKGWSNKRAKKE
jgi:hypothetical protein